MPSFETSHHAPTPKLSPVQAGSSIQSARPYQVEILEQSIKENTIVCLGTGTGKTFISVMLIKEKQGQIKGKLAEGGKRTFFLVNTGKHILILVLTTVFSINISTICIFHKQLVYKYITL